MRGQNGSGVKTRSGLQKAPHQIREPLVAPLECQQPAAGQSQRTGREETVSGAGCAATGETPALPFPNGEEIQCESLGPGDIAAAQATGVPFQCLVETAVDAADGGFGYRGGQPQVDKQADRPGVGSGQIAEGHFHGPCSDGFGRKPGRLEMGAFPLGVGSDDREVQRRQPGRIIARWDQPVVLRRFRGRGFGQDADQVEFILPAGLEGMARLAAAGAAQSGGGRHWVGGPGDSADDGHAGSARPETITGPRGGDAADRHHRQCCPCDDFLQAVDAPDRFGVGLGARGIHRSAAHVITWRQIGPVQFVQRGDGNADEGGRP